MSTTVWVTMGVMLGIISPFVLIQIQRRRAAATGSGAPSRLSRKDSGRPSNPFAAVSIRPCPESPCAAVRQVHRQRFLAARAPSLPVAGCNRKKCGCRYVRYTDRRARTGRRDLFARFGGFTPAKVGKDRRAIRDRREEVT